MPSLLIRLLLFLSSYFPLAVIFAVQLYLKNHAFWSVVCLLAGFSGLIGLAAFMRTSTKINPLTIKVATVSRRDGEAMSYIVTYLLPFIALPSGDLASGISLGIFLVVLAILYVNSDMMHINPMLNLTGWHIYEITLPQGETYTVIAKKRVRKGMELEVTQMADWIYLEAPK